MTQAGLNPTTLAKIIHCSQPMLREVLADPEGPVDIVSILVARVSDHFNIPRPSQDFDAEDLEKLKKLKRLRAANKDMYDSFSTLLDQAVKATPDPKK
jgi:hypothetical protein